MDPSTFTLPCASDCLRSRELLLVARLVSAMTLGRSLVQIDGRALDLSGRGLHTWWQATPLRAHLSEERLLSGGVVYYGLMLRLVMAGHHGVAHVLLTVSAASANSLASPAQVSRPGCATANLIEQWSTTQARLVDTRC